MENARTDIEKAVKEWRDEAGFGISVEVSRVVGEDWVNYDLMELETVRNADVVKLGRLPNVANFACDFVKKSLVVRVEKRSDPRRAAGAGDSASPESLRDDDDLRDFEKRLARTECEKAEVESVMSCLEAFKRGLLRDRLMLRGGRLTLEARDSPGVLTVFAKNLKVAGASSLRSLHEEGGDGLDAWIDFAHDSLKLVFIKSKSVIF